MKLFGKLSAAVLFASSIVACSSSPLKHYKVEVVAEYPHDTESYTQGLFFRDGRLYESTGLHGKSTFREVDLKTGKALKRIDFSPRYFGEGSVMLGDNLYILTWDTNVAFIYDASTLKFKSGWSYPREGWGITTDGRQLIASDGSDKLFFMDGDFKLLRQVNVTMDGSPVNLLNELEWIDGKVWANVYTTDNIVIINPKTGVVEGEVDCTGLLPRKLRSPETDVLNGIAYEPVSGRIFLTGKNWPRLYEIRLAEKR